MASVDEGEAAGRGCSGLGAHSVESSGQQPESDDPGEYGEKDEEDHAERWDANDSGGERDAQSGSPEHRFEHSPVHAGCPFRTI